MTKKTLLIIHGMGQHTKASVKSEVNSALTAAFKLYPSLDGKSPASQITVKTLEYGSFFEKYRKSISKESGLLSDKIKMVDVANSLLSGSIETINSLGEKFGEDEFFYTHLLDVILYRYSILAERIRLHIAEEIALVVSQVGSANLHVLGHSLGTAVLHDALQKSYGPESLEDGDKIKLSVIDHKLGGVHMVSNVSRILQSFAKVGSSVVRPGQYGCTSAFTEYRHKLDPFTYVKPFDPTNNGGWVEQETFKHAYRLVHDGLTEVTAANVHSLSHYIANPSVHLLLFKSLFGFSPNKPERESAESKYLEATVQGKAIAVQEAFGGLAAGSDDSVEALLRSAMGLKELLDGFSEGF